MKIKKFLSIVLITCMLFNTGCAGCGKNTSNELQTVVETVTNSDGEVIGTEIQTIDKEVASQSNKNAEWEAKVVEAGGIIPEYGKGKLVAPYDESLVPYILSDIKEWQNIDMVNNWSKSWSKTIKTKDLEWAVAEIDSTDKSGYYDLYVNAYDKALKYAYALMGVGIGEEMESYCYCKTSEIKKMWNIDALYEPVYIQVQNIHFDDTQGLATASVMVILNSNMNPNNKYTPVGNEINNTIPLWFNVTMSHNGGKLTIMDRTGYVSDDNGFTEWNDIKYQKFYFYENGKCSVISRSAAD